MSPLDSAVAPDGRVALGWSVRRQLRPANRVAFGRELAELAPSGRDHWRAREVLTPTVGYDPPDDSAASAVTFGPRDGVVEDWVTNTQTASRLILARQVEPGGVFHRRAILRTGAATTIQPAGLAVGGSGDPLIAATVTPPGHAIALTPSVHVPRESAYAVTTDAGGTRPSLQLLRRGCSAQGLATRASGEAAVVLLCGLTARHGQIRVSERASHSRFTPALRVSAPGLDGVFPTVSITATGRVCVVWDDAVGVARHYDANVVRTEVSCAAPGHPFGRPTWRTSAYPTQLNPPQLLQGPSGPAIVRGRRGEQVVLQRLLPHGRLGPIDALSGPNARNQVVAVDRQGDGVAVWDASVDHQNRPEARTFTLP